MAKYFQQQKGSAMSYLRYVIEDTNSDHNVKISGNETEKIIREHKHIIGQWGSERIIRLNQNGEPLGGVHIVRLRERYIISSIFVEKHFRRKGVATQIVKYAQELYKNLEFSEDRTEEGKVFFASIEADFHRLERR